VASRGVVCLLAASASPESITRAMGAAQLAPHQATIASADQTPLSRLSKRRWYVLGSLSGAIPSIRLYLSPLS